MTDAKMAQCEAERERERTDLQDEYESVCQELSTAICGKIDELNTNVTKLGNLMDDMYTDEEPLDDLLNGLGISLN